MSIALDVFCFDTPFTILFCDTMPVSTGVGGCEWLIFTRENFMDVFLWQFSKNSPISVSVADSIMSLMILYSMCTGPFSGGIDVISVLDFGSR